MSEEEALTRRSRDQPGGQDADSMEFMLDICFMRLSDGLLWMMKCVCRSK